MDTELGPRFSFFIDYCSMRDQQRVKMTANLILYKYGNVLTYSQVRSVLEEIAELERTHRAFFLLLTMYGTKGGHKSGNKSLPNGGHNCQQRGGQQCQRCVSIKEKKQRLPYERRKGGEKGSQKWAQRISHREYVVDNSIKLGLKVHKDEICIF